MSAAPHGGPAAAATADRRSRGLGAPILQIAGLSVDYGEGAGATHAVVDVDLTLHRGEVLGLAGESGSGKSTLVYGATRLLRAPGVIAAGDAWFYPDPADPSQRVNLIEADIKDMQQLRWSQISLVFQSAMHSLNPVLTVQTQLMDTLAAHQPESPRAQRLERAAEMLSLVGISRDRLRSYPHELSGGMRQRVMIAMALLLEPQVVIMDEPTTALDVVTQREILQQIIDLRDRLGFSVLFITHDFSLLVEMADTIAVMYAGRVVEFAPARQLFRAPRHPYTLGLLNSFPSLRGAIRPLQGIPGSPPDLRHIPAGCAFHPRCAYGMARCTAELPLLSQVGQAGERRVACWLHADPAHPPAELARSEDGGQQAAVAVDAATDAGRAAPVGIRPPGGQ